MGSDSYLRRPRGGTPAVSRPFPTMVPVECCSRFDMLVRSAYEQPYRTALRRRVPLGSRLTRLFVSERVTAESDAEAY